MNSNCFLLSISCPTSTLSISSIVSNILPRLVLYCGILRVQLYLFFINSTIANVTNGQTSILITMFCVCTRRPMSFSGQFCDIGVDKEIDFKNHFQVV